MTTPFENFVNIALGKSVSADVTLPTADEIKVLSNYKDAVENLGD